MKTFTQKPSILKICNTEKINLKPVSISGSGARTKYEARLLFVVRQCCLKYIYFIIKLVHQYIKNVKKIKK